MKHSELKTLWKVAKRFWIAGFIIWVVKTISFLIYEGWHHKATNPVEIYIDRLVGYNGTVASFLTIYVCFYFIINLNKEE